MSNFKVGDRVRCVDASSHDYKTFYNPLVKGREYISNNVGRCPKCNAVELKVGVIVKEDYNAFCRCGYKRRILVGEQAPCGAYRFEKVLEKTEYIAVAVDVKIEEPVLN